jgi:TonB-linked SusC/RagA family outer membrane protein
VQGIVIDEGGEPVIGVSVFAQESQIGTTTDVDGKFQISVPQSVTELSFKYLGMNFQTVRIKEGVMQVIMTNEDQALEEVVVSIAYGEAKRKALTGAVTAVNAKQIEQRPVTSVSSVLEGKMGIMVNSTYGQPGNEPEVRIRGFGSINGTNAPLYILDGVPFGGNISDINTQDIESVSVLKDAASTALYGNRAANGVVLLTTKKGQNKKTRLSLFVNQGLFQRGIPEYDRLGTDEWMESAWIGYRNGFISGNGMSVEEANATANNEIVPTYFKYNIYNKADNELFSADGKLQAKIKDGYKDDLDWFKPGLRNGYRQEYVISGDGANDKSDYYFSAAYLDEQGYVKNAGFNRFSGRVKINFIPNKWFKTGLSLNATAQEINNTNGDANSYTNLLSMARSMAPIYPVHLHDMTTGEYELDASLNKIYDSGEKYNRPQQVKRHSIWETELNTDQTSRKTMDGSLYAQITFLKDFNFKVNGNLNERVSENNIYDNATIGDGAGNNARAGFTDYTYKEYTFQQQLTWKKLFAEKHYFDVLAAHENYSYNRIYSYARKSDEIFPGQIDLVNFNSITSLTGYTDNYRLESFLSRLSYNYDDKYFIDASFRRDGSSRFYKSNRWGNFWSLGGNWIVSNEAFMATLKDKINFLKIRTNYGETGNDASVGYYGYMALWSLSAKNALSGTLIKSQLEALDIKWEASTSFGLALEGRLFNRIDFSAEYFDRRSRDLLFDVNLPTSAGATKTDETSPYITKNIGSVANRGIEASVNVDIIKSKDFNWNAGLDLTTFKNKILRLPDENRENGIISGTKKYTEGRGVYDFWVYQFAGVDQMSGRSLYLLNDKDYYVGEANPEETRSLVPAENTININGVDYVYKTTYAKRDFTSSAIPDVFGNFNTNVSYKNLALGVIFTYSLGGKMMDAAYISYMSIGGTSPGSLHKDVLKSWNGVPAGMTETSPDRVDKNVIPILDPNYSADNNATSSRFLQDASFLVLKNINLSYSIPGKIVRKLDLSAVKLNFTVENLFTLTSLKGMNPQASFNGAPNSYLALPTPRVISLGLKIDF